MPDPQSLLRLAVTTAEGAGDLLLAGLGQARTTVEHKSSATDMVTEMDRAAEAFIVEQLEAARPDDGLLGEEGASSPGTSGVRWIIDPLDGTTNYLYRFPVYAVSLAAEVDGVVVAAVVRDVAHGETFTAVRGDGAWCNGIRLRITSPPDLSGALIGTGFAYLPERRAWQARVLSNLLGSVRDIRRAGSAAIDLCWVAAGRLDGFYERGLQPWDHAGGALVASEAGAEVGDLDGGPPSTDIVVAAAPSIAADLRRLLVAAEAAACPRP